MTLQQLLDEGTEKLKKSGVPDAGLDAKYLLMEAFGLSESRLLLDRSRDAAGEEDGLSAQEHYREMLKKRCARVPLQYILGTQEFMGLTFQVDERVLIPRQDTEDLVELILRDHPEREKRILDMCTGSGCIAISLAVLGGYREVTAADVSDGALAAAGDNAARLQAAKSGAAGSKTERGGRVRFVRSDMFECGEELLGAGGERYDILVSNPPYIPTGVIAGLQPEVKDFEPMEALDGTGDGLYFYRILSDQGRRFLVPGGSIYVEIGYDQGAAVSELFGNAGYQEIEVMKDTPGLDRIVKAKFTGKSPSYLSGGSE